MKVNIVITEKNGVLWGDPVAFENIIDAQGYFKLECESMGITPEENHENGIDIYLYEDINVVKEPSK